MNNITEIQLEYKYTPEGYFEEPISIKENEFTISINNGVALAKIPPSHYDKVEKIKNRITQIIENRFQAVQIMSHRDYDLSKACRSDIREDGGKNIFLEVDSAVIAVSSCSADIIITDKDGNVKVDTKKERLSKQEWFSETVSKHRKSDNCLDQMLNSYQMAVKDKKNELIHLYEVRDALSARFGSKQKAILKTGISTKDWDTIGKLANHFPIEQGRHRGKSAGVLRPASRDELDTARKIISNFVEKYLIYLEKNETLTIGST